MNTTEEKQECVILVNTEQWQSTIMDLWEIGPSLTESCVSIIRKDENDAVETGRKKALECLAHLCLEILGVTHMLSRVSAHASKEAKARY